MRTQADDRVAELLIHYFETAPERPTLRDQFAMAALPGVMAGYGMGFDDAAISAAAYVIADAMLEARK
jgi:hypothetical protein